jgi:arylsulfatase A-like enzyme
VARVVFLIVDALPPRHVSAALTPTLARLAAEGGSSTGRAVMTSATYPNHATFATGVDPIEHGVLANWIVSGGRPRPSAEVGPSVPTIFDRCRAAGRSSAAVLGDQHLVPIMGARAADKHWPPNGVLGDDVRRDGHGYAANDEVMSRLLPVLGDDRPDLVVGHLNEPDTAAHVHGPDSEDALASYRDADTAIADIVDALAPSWDDTVLIVVSDHDQEDVDVPIDLYAPLAASGLRLFAIPEGTAAVIWGDDESNGAWLDRIDGIEGHEEIGPGTRLVWSAPRHWFMPPPGFASDPPDRGTHGGIRTRNQVAIVAGRHAAARELAASVRGRDRVDARDWAPAVLHILEA